MGTHRRLAITLAASVAVFAAAAAAARAQGAPPTVVIVVRHAEKAAVEGSDPPLSEAGAKRAQRLAGVAEDAGVEAIYTTQFKRTRDTAQPAADRLKVPVTAVEVTRENINSHPASLAKEILSKHKGKSVLVVGHSNTTTMIVEALSGRKVPALDDATDFDALFVVVLPDAGAPRLVKGKY